MAGHRVTVDRKVCTGFGACVELCPGSFYLSKEDGKSKIRGAREVVEGGENVKDVMETDDLGCYGKAADACPFNAITVEDL